MEVWVRKRLGDATVSGNGNELRASCPFCNARVGRPDAKRHLYISLVKPVAFCHRCSWSGHYIGLIMSVEGCSYTQALRLMDSPAVDVQEFDNLYSPRGLVCGDAHARQPSGFTPILDKLVGGDFEERKAVLRYLRARNVPTNLVNTKFGWIAGSHRVWMLVDRNWWQGRLIIPGKPKYISPPWPIGDSLWNAKALRSYDQIVVCEGVFSAIAVGNNAIAICAKHATDLQIKRMVRTRAASITLMLDADAKTNAHALADKLSYAGYAGMVYIQYMESGDPAEGENGPLVEWTWAERVMAGLVSQF